MEPGMSPAAKRDLLESQLASKREALLHATCTMLENLGFKLTAWNADTYCLLDSAFEACAVVQLQPRVVITKLLQAIDAKDPGDTREELLSVIIDIISEVENPLGSDF